MESTDLFAVYHNLAMQVFDRRKRAWKVVWYLQIEDAEGNALSLPDKIGFNDFFFEDDYIWEEEKDTYPTLDYPLFVGRGAEIDDYVESKHSARPYDEMDTECHFMTNMRTRLRSGYFHVQDGDELMPWSELYQKCKDAEHRDSVQEYYNLVQRFLILARMQLYMLSKSADEPPREFPRDCVVQYHEDDDELVSPNRKRRRCLPSVEQLEQQELQLRQTRRDARCRCLDVLFRRMTGGLALPQVLLEEKILSYAPPEPPRKVRLHYSKGAWARERQFYLNWWRGN